MSEKRLTRSMLVPLLSLRKKGWKGMTGHPIDWEKDLNLNSRTSFLKSRETDTAYQI